MGSSTDPGASLTMDNTIGEVVSQTTPNLLWICSDQQTGNALGCVNSFLSTPNLDDLVNRGVHFDRAYCTQPVCGPSRASMMTGRMPVETGVTRNGSGPEEFVDRSIGTLVRDAGYEAVHAGKWHLPSYHEAAEANQYGFDVLCNLNDEKVPGACARFFAEHDGERPFFMSAQLHNPHNIIEWGRNQPLPWSGEISDVSTEECPPLPQNFPIPPFEPGPIEGYRDTTRTHRGAIATEWSDEVWRHYRHAYFRLVERVDDAVGEILDALTAHGLREETVIIFTSDHGEMNGAHKLNQKYTLYDESVRVPLIIDAPGEYHGIANQLVSTGLDLLPTFCDYAGANTPNDLIGRSLRPIIHGESPEWRDAVFAETHNYKLNGRMVRTDRYKYTVYGLGRYREQLFDMKQDPGEMVNLATDARHSDVLQFHRELLADWCVETGDLYGEQSERPGVPAIPGISFEAMEERFGVTR